MSGCCWLLNYFLTKKMHKFELKTPENQCNAEYRPQTFSQTFVVDNFYKIYFLAVVILLSN